MESTDSGRARRYFKITRQGLAVVKEAREAHARLWQGLDRVLRAHRS